ncbi:MAG: hypothetical protein LBL52_00915 [Rickettsiales bacterium]|jgi:hypothetical protein|nr:hypothetical protein [Rickettsiales bacterium]
MASSKAKDKVISGLEETIEDLKRENDRLHRIIGRSPKKTNGARPSRPEISASINIITGRWNSGRGEPR